MSSETSWIRVQETIIDLIKNDQRLRNDVRGVFQYVPRNRIFPFIVIGEGVENQFDTFELEGKQLTLQISIWTADKGFKRAYEILDRVNEILDCQDLSFQDFSTVTVDFDRANAIRHVLNSTNQIVSRYRITVQEFVVGVINVRSSVAAESDIEAVLNAIFVLAGDINAQSDVDPTLIIVSQMEGDINGDSTADGTMNAIFALNGDVDALSTVVGDMQVLIDLNGDINSQSTATGDMQILIDLTGDVNGQSTVTGDMQILIDLTGDITAQSTVTGDMQILIDLTSDVTAQSTATGDMQVLIDLTGDVTAQSTVNGDMQVLIDLTGDITAQSTATGDMQVLIDLTGDVNGQSTANGDMQVLIDLTGDITAQSTVTGDLTVEAQEVLLSGDINAQSTVEGDLIVSHLAIHDGSRIATKTISSLGSTRLNADSTDLANRHTVIVFNTSQEQIWVGFEDTVQVDEGIMIPSNDERSFIVDPNDPKALWAIAENQNVNVIIAEIE